MNIQHLLYRLRAAYSAFSDPDLVALGRVARIPKAQHQYARFIRLGEGSAAYVVAGVV